MSEVEKDSVDEPTYTLAEARGILNRLECDREGHDIQSEIVSAQMGPVRQLVYCSRCGAHFKELP